MRKRLEEEEEEGVGKRFEEEKGGVEEEGVGNRFEEGKGRSE